VSILTDKNEKNARKEISQKIIPAYIWRKYITRRLKKTARTNRPHPKRKI